MSRPGWTPVPDLAIALVVLHLAGDGARWLLHWCRHAGTDTPDAVLLAGALGFFALVAVQIVAGMAGLMLLGEGLRRWWVRS